MSSFLRGALLCLLMAGACHQDWLDYPPPPDAVDQLDYFPLHQGNWVAYRVDSVLFDYPETPGGVRDTVSLYVLEVVSDSFTDLTGQTGFRIDCYEKKHASDPWTLKRSDAAWRTGTQAVRTDANQRFLKLVFPMQERTEWDGNRWINPEQDIEVLGESLKPFGGWRYRADSIHFSGLARDMYFDSLLAVTETQTESAIEFRRSKAIYAKNVGLVYKEQWILDSQYCNQSPSPSDCLTKPWTRKAEKGYIVTMWVTDHP
jgi:hypothetical protein